ncbi:glycosyltransferase family 4 protein [Leucobacter iarius]|uniref:D-inositol 3-phosphate glycosyltransferase n=1 Tax=Leucobacter iarius TaxID=333963 RepID=A0ABN2L9W9_9MICO
MRVAIASRIFEPEPSAASVRLAALANALTEAGHEVTVLTVKPPKHLAAAADDGARAYRVRRFPVLRDRTGYVRGYLQYLSFDVPLLFRILFGSRFDAVVIEPPPTTGFFGRIATAIRRTPYVYYAADIWSDAASQTGAGGAIVRIVAAVERWVLRGARIVLAVSPGVRDRLAELGITEGVTMIGNGVDVTPYGADGAAVETEHPTFVYAGTASEWHGAEVLVDAFAAVRAQREDARLLFIGGGSERERLVERTHELGVSAAVEFRPVLPPAALAEVLRGAAASVATCRPGAGYDFAFPTKLYSSAACGTPVIFAGLGPALEFVRSEVDGRAIGEGTPWDAEELAAAMLRELAAPATPAQRSATAAWAADNVSIRRSAQAAVREIEQEIGPGTR